MVIYELSKENPYCKIFECTRHEHGNQLHINRNKPKAFSYVVITNGRNISQINILSQFLIAFTFQHLFFIP